MFYADCVSQQMHTHKLKLVWYFKYGIAIIVIP